MNESGGKFAIFDWYSTREAHITINQEWEVKVLVPISPSSQKGCRQMNLLRIVGACFVTALAGCPSYLPINSVKALTGTVIYDVIII